MHWISFCFTRAEFPISLFDYVNIFSPAQNSTDLLPLCRHHLRLSSQ